MELTDTLDVTEVAKMFDITRRYAINPINKIHYCYLGNCKFDKQKIKAYKKQLDYNNWFEQQIGLFIEYLNKIIGISYTEMAAKIDTCINNVSTHKLNRKRQAKLLVKYRSFALSFDRYYNQL